MSTMLKYPVVRLEALAAGQRNAMVGGPFGSNLVSRDYTAEGVPVIRGTNLPASKYVSEQDFVFVSERKADQLRTNTAQAGDLVFTQRGTLGQVGIIPQDTGFSRYIISQSQMKMSVDTAKASVDYLYYYFRMPSTVTYIENHAIQAGVPHINLGILKRLEVVLPPLLTQRKIAAILAAYDDLIETNKRRIALLEKMAEEIYREWFVRMRFPGHEKTKFIKGVPEGWGVKPIKSFCEEIRDGVRKKDLADDESYVGLEHIPRKSISLANWGTAGSVDSNKLRFNNRDILFSKIRPYLHKVALAHFSGACSSDTIVLRPRESQYEGFLLYTVFSETFIELATIASKGTKMPRADWAFLEKLELKVPPQDLLKMFQDRFSELFSLITMLLKSNQEAMKARDLLLPRLISGKLPVEDLDIQFPPGMQ